MSADRRPAPTLMEICDVAAGAPALEDGRRTVSFGELERRSNAIGREMEAAGLAPGDHVLLAVSNRVEFVECLVGAMRAGMVVTPAKTSWTPDEMGGVLADAGSGLVVSDVSSGRVAARRAGIPLLDLDGDFEARIGSRDGGPLPAERRGFRMSFTSGTTGRPKGVVRYADGAQPWCEAFRRSAAYAEILHMPADGPHLCVSALYHGAPLAFALSILAAGACVRILPRWDPALAMAELARGVRSTILVPTMFRQLLELPASVRDGLRAPELRAVVHGGEPCPRPLKRRMIEWLGPVLVEYYGMTEGGMTVATTEEWLARPGTVGRATRGMEIRILDDDRRALPPGEEGTIYFRSPSGRYFEYRGAPEKTDAAHAPDGSFTVGDIGWLDADGYLFISGRRADVIVTGGVNVYPAEIEDVLYAIPAVRDACVVGGPDETRGETPVAFVALARENGDAAAALARIEAACAERLAGYKRPRRFVEVAEIPRDGTGKLLRRTLRDGLWQGRSGFAARKS